MHIGTSGICSTSRRSRDSGRHESWEETHEERLQWRKAGANYARVDLDIGPDGGIGVSPGNIVRVGDDVEGLETKDTGNAGERADSENAHERKLLATREL